MLTGLLIKNIRCLVQTEDVAKLKVCGNEMSELNTITDALTHGSIARGKVANVFITKEIPSYEFMPYAFGSNLIEKIILKGKLIS